ncbi:hypothetical protein B0H11DRAFT_1899282 [Mycena galericulata]|nr:hypothetical protein B0H11DRAFT_1899282 [Mycena galericulata]
MESAMIMTHDGVFMNPARVSPSLIETRPISNGNTQRRIHVDGKVAICVSPGMCSESFLTRPHTGSGVNGRKRKFIALTFHNQEWERWESFMCLCFAQPHLFTPMTKTAIHLGSMLDVKASNTKKTEDDGTNMAISSMLTPVKASSSGRTRPSGPPASSPSTSWQSDPDRARYTYMVDETIPAYDATSKDFDFRTDLAALKTKLPLWVGEIPIGSFVVAGLETIYAFAQPVGYVSWQSGFAESIIVQRLLDALSVPVARAKSVIIHTNLDALVRNFRLAFADTASPRLKRLEVVYRPSLFTDLPVVREADGLEGWRWIVFERRAGRWIGFAPRLIGFHLVSAHPFHRRPFRF